MLVHCHPSSPATGAYSFFEEQNRILCVQCDVCTDTRTSCSMPHPRRLGNVQLIPYPRELQQNKRWEWESNLCPSASTGSPVQLTTPRLTVPDHLHILCPQCSVRCSVVKWSNVSATHGVLTLVLHGQTT